MLVQVHFSGFEPAKKLRSTIDEQFQSVLAKFSRHVQEVQLHVEDVNGPRGGIDKQCRCVVQLAGMPPVVIEDRDESVGRVVDRVSHRVVQTLRRRVEKRDSRRG